MKLKAPSHGTVVAYIALFFAMGGTAVAATGGTFILGGSNTAGRQTFLSNTASTPVLGLRARPGQAPLAVSAGSGKVSNLNADALDGVDASQLQRRVAGTCPPNQAVTSIHGDGSVACIALQPAASPVPSPTSSPAPSPTYQDQNFVLSDVSTRSDASGNWTALGTIVNQNATRKSAQFQITVQQNGAGVATLTGSVSQLAPGASTAVQFFSQNPYNAGPAVLQFKTTASFDA